MHIDLTNHVIEQVIKRTHKKDIKGASLYVKSLFQILLANDEWKGREIIVKPTKNLSFLITDGKHKIVYKKTGPACYHLITYAKKTEGDKIESLFHKIFRK